MVQIHLGPPNNFRNGVMMIVTGLRCLSCGDVIFSRARHDFMTCSCGKVSIDGGFDYNKISGERDNFVFLKLTLADWITSQVLFDDWNNPKSSKFGKYVNGDISIGHIIDVNAKDETI